MTDQISPTNEERIIQELSHMRQAMDSMKATFEAKFEVALKPVERGLRSITLIPLALIFGGTSSWLFYVGRITESTWFYITVFLMMPFFGDGIRALLDRLPLNQVTKAAKSLLLGVALLLLCACAVTFPLGEDGKYGEVYAGYRLPSKFGDIILNQPTLHDK